MTSKMKTYYVHLFLRWVSRGPNQGQWIPAVGVTPGEQGSPLHQVSVDHSIAMYEVQTTTRASAADIVTHWLATGRPQIMTVREIWRKT